MKKYVHLTVAIAAVVLFSASNGWSRDTQKHSGKTTVGQGQTSSSLTGSQSNQTNATTNPQRTNRSSKWQSGNTDATTMKTQQANPNTSTQSTTGSTTTTEANQLQRFGKTAGQGQSNWLQQNRTAQTNNAWARYNHLFTPQWYARHPQVGRQVSANTNVWTSTATWSTLANWLGMSSNQPYEYSAVYTDETYFVTDDGVVGEEQVTVETTPTEQTSQNPAELAAQGYTGETSTTNATDWLSVGVFTIASPGSTSTPDRVFQFSVNKNGHIAGVYYDAFSGQAHRVQGAVNKTTQQAAWTVDSNRETVMQTNLGSFAQNQGKVLVHQGKGQTNEWIMTRVEGPSANQVDQPTNTTPSGEQTTTGQTNTQNTTGTSNTQGTNSNYGTMGTN